MFEFFEPMPLNKAENLSPVTLAFVGDAVYSLFVRHKLVLAADYTAGTLQKLSSAEVSAHGQNQRLRSIESRFTEEEAAIFKRGRNAKKPSHSKNADLAEYNNSTGFEAVLGWLYITGQNQRLLQLLEDKQ